MNKQPDFVQKLKRRRSVVAPCFVMLGALVMYFLSGCGCICYDVVSPKNIGDIARSNITNMYGKYSVRVEDVPCRTNEDGVREAFKKELMSRIGNGRDGQLMISISDHECVDKSEKTLGAIVGCITWFVLPLWAPAVHNYTIEIANGKFHKACKLIFNETRYVSILPWSFLPALWSQEWFVAYGDCDRTDQWKRERIVETVIAQLDEEFYMLGKYGLEEYERMRRDQKSVAEAFARQQQSEDIQKQKETEALQELRLREFALAQAPALWETYQSFKDEIGGLDTRMESLKSDLIDFGHDPEKDPDYKGIVSMRAEMGETLKSLRNRLVDAYFAFCKFRATPGEKRNEEIFEKVRQEGLQEAGAAKARFDEMRKVK